MPCHRTQVPYSGLGLYDAALAGAERACEHDDRGFGFSLAEFVKAGALGYTPEVGATARDRDRRRPRHRGRTRSVARLPRERMMATDVGASMLGSREQTKQAALTVERNRGRGGVAETDGHSGERPRLRQRGRPRPGCHS